ncbi:MAG: sigma-70 family RNA polymerase sigma factor [Bacteroidales bacterium]|nr:sigma-70 family RNA polymerase sigma factor [Bacteroidales bacterium]
MQTISKDIVRRCKDGDKNAFRMIVVQYQRMIFSLAIKMLGDEEEAKDTVQDVFMKAWLEMRRYDEQYELSTWLYTIASRVCLDKKRKMKRIVPLPTDEEVLRDYCASDMQHQLENREWVSIVRVIAEGLSDKQRLVFTLSQLEGLKSQQIEEITGLDATQVKSNLYVARKSVKERLKKLGYEE